jgi:hypothetical protein
MISPHKTFEKMELTEKYEDGGNKKVFFHLLFLITL